MIKLTDLLLEAINKPKAIFLAGSPGSGKSYLSKQLIPKGFISINVDDTYEELLKSSGLSTKIKDFNPDQLSKAASMMGQATKSTKEKFEDLSKQLKNIIIDGTGAASNPILNKKQELETLGYECFMIVIYTSPMTSLERNKQRDRSLPADVLLRTWLSVYKNIDIYKKEFGNNFAIINNEPEIPLETFSL